MSTSPRQERSTLVGDRLSQRRLLHQGITLLRCAMRTTIDLPEDLYEQAKCLARDTSRTLSETVADLVRRGLEGAGAVATVRSDRTGLPVVSLGRTIISEDVRLLDDDPP
jgi:hypothetical protein